MAAGGGESQLVEEKIWQRLWFCATRRSKRALSTLWHVCCRVAFAMRHWLG